MALQGTFDAFPLTEVLQVLGRPGRIGALEMQVADREVVLFLHDGAVVGCAVDDQLADPMAVMWDLVSVGRGTFTYVAERQPAEACAPLPVDGIVETLAQARPLVDPDASMDRVATLGAELVPDEVVLTRERWRMVVALAAGGTLADVATMLAMDNATVLGVVADFIDVGMVVLGEPTTPGAVTAEEVGEAPEFEVVGPVGEAPEFEVVGPVGEAPELEVVEPVAHPVRVDEELLDPQIVQLAEALAGLPPQAARAVARAARASTTAEREAALAELDTPESTVDRGMLLRFLGTMDP